MSAFISHYVTNEKRAGLQHEILIITFFQPTLAIYKSLAPNENTHFRLP